MNLVRTPRTLLALTLAFALALATPLAAAKEKPQPDYPDHVLGLMPAFLSEAEELVEADDREETWWPEANEWLVNASNASEADRFRIVIFDLETFTEVLLTKQLMDEAASLPNDAERKQFVIQRTTAWRQDADRAWEAYRAKLHEYDGEIRSLRTLETALYSADLAITAAATAALHPQLAREFPAEPGFEEGYVIAMVRYSHTPLLKIGWAQAVLQAAADIEGTGARIQEEAWNNLTTLALQINGTGVSSIEQIRALGQPVRDNGEGTLAVAFALAEQRSGRLAEIQLLYGDAQTRKNVVNDAATFMGRRLENLTLEYPRNIGLDGIFTSDAADRALYALEFHEKGAADLGLLVATWASIDAADQLVLALAPVSPITPPAPEEDDRDAPLAPWLALAGVAVVALALRRRGRG